LFGLWFSNISESGSTRRGKLVYFKQEWLPWL